MADSNPAPPLGCGVSSPLICNGSESRSWTPFEFECFKKSWRPQFGKRQRGANPYRLSVMGSSWGRGQWCITAKLISIDHFANTAFSHFVYVGACTNSLYQTRSLLISVICAISERQTWTQVYMWCQHLRVDVSDGHDIIKRAKNVVVRKSNKYSMLKIRSFLGFMTKFS